jgi:hypothetical protein
MNKKPGLLLVVSLLAMIILATSFGFNFGGNPPVQLRAGINPDTVLYVCPVAESTWVSVSNSLHLIGKYVNVMFFFAAFVLLFSWAWAFYQNLLKDKFNDDVYKNPWGLTKVIFWGVVIYTVLFMTPNHFRRVDVRGSNNQYVLCENTSTGARPVKSGAVTMR